MDIAGIAETLGIIRRSDTPATGGTITIPAREDITDIAVLSTINVYRAVDIISLAAAQLTIDVWRGSDQVTPRPSLARQPDIRHRRRSWIKRNVASLALTGNAYWLLHRGPDDQVISIEVLDPHECTPDRHGHLHWAKRDQPLTPAEHRHLKLVDIPGRTHGLGPIQAARHELTAAVRVGRYGAEIYDVAGIPSGILKSDQPLTAAQADLYKDRWQSRKAHEVAVLGQGLDYKPVLLSPEDAQFLETRQFDTTAVARLFGIPPRLFLAVVEGSALTYANASQEDLSFVRWTLTDYLGEIEEALSSVLPRTQEARFNLDGILRPDIETRYRAHASGIEAGWLRKSEVRAIEGLPPIPGIDTTQPAQEATHEA